MESDLTKEEKDLVREFSRPVYDSKNWIRFLGVIMIIYGIFTALTLVGILIAWLPIWLGVLLMKTASRIENAHTLGDRYAMIGAQETISRFFSIYGVLALIGIILGAVFSAVFFATGMMTSIQEAIPGIY